MDGDVISVENLQQPEAVGSSERKENQTESKVSTDHPIFVEDPGQWMEYVHKSVCVTTSAEGSYSGRVYTIDPVSQSVVLVALSEDDQAVTSINVIMGHAVDKITVLDSQPLSRKGINCLDALFKQPQQTVSPGFNVGEQMENVRSWLVRNKIPVSVTVDAEGQECLNISDALCIVPPYLPENCQCGNAIMLGKVQALIRNMPHTATS